MPDITPSCPIFYNLKDEMIWAIFFVHQCIIIIIANIHAPMALKKVTWGPDIKLNKLKCISDKLK